MRRVVVSSLSRSAKSNASGVSVPRLVLERAVFGLASDEKKWDTGIPESQSERASSKKKGITQSAARRRVAEGRLQAGAQRNLVHTRLVGRAAAPPSACESERWS